MVLTVKEMFTSLYICRTYYQCWIYYTAYMWINSITSEVPVLFMISKCHSDALLMNLTAAVIRDRWNNFFHHCFVNYCVSYRCID